MDSPPQTAVRLQPRFRRLLSFGDVLDESMLLFRRHWITFALVSAVSLLPPGVVLVSLSAGGMMSQSFSVADIQSGRLANSAAIDSRLLAQIAGVFLYVLVYSIFGLLWSAAIVVTTDSYLRGEPPALGRVYRQALRRYFSVFLSTLVLGLGVFVLILLAGVLFVVTIFGIAGSLIAIVALLIWWLNPGARKTWVKWLIILTTPSGLAMYVGTRWALYLAAAVLEHKGPVDALRRSYELTERHWLRVAATLMIASLIVGVMLSFVGALATVPFAIADAFRGQIGLSPTETAISSAVTFVARILLASIGSIVYTLLFVDLRNRREGTDIGERVSQLEASLLPANG